MVITKNNGFFLILVLVVGAAIGWFLRGGAVDDRMGDDKSRPNTSVVSTAARSGDGDSDNAPVAGKRAIREVPPEKSVDAIAQILQPDSEAMKDMQSQAIKMMAAQNRAKLQQRIDKLTEALGLTDVQRAGLQSWLDERIAKMEGMSIEDMGKLGDDGDLMKSLTNQALEEQLAATLTEEQKTALEEFKTRDTQSRIDSVALKSLSQMQGVIEFEEGQRDAAYKILHDAAAARIEKENGNPDSSALSLDGMGIDLDPYDLGIQDAMKEAALNTGTSGDGTDGNQMAENFRAAIDQRIEAKVDQMRPVLNDKQLEQYRTELKNKGSGILGGAMMGLGNGGSGASSIVIPAN